MRGNIIYAWMWIRAHFGDKEKTSVYVYACVRENNIEKVHTKVRQRVMSVKWVSEEERNRESMSKGEETRKRMSEWVSELRTERGKSDIYIHTYIHKWETLTKTERENWTRVWIYICEWVRK